MVPLFILFLGLCQTILADKTYIGVNGKWPCPAIDVMAGETVTVNINNKLGNQSTAMHWHGLDQRDTYQMDGPAAVTQCPIPPGSRFTYKWKADRPGSFWYHAHNKGQYVDGLRGPLIIRDPNPPWKNQVEKEFTVTMSDWYHTQMPFLLHEYQSTSNPDGKEPIPDAGLLNDGQGAKYNVKPGKTYLFRFINMGAFPSFFINFKNHKMTIVEMDAVYTQPTEVNTFYCGVAMRYTVLVTMNADASQNYGILALLDTSMFEGQTSSNPNFQAAVMGQLVYNKNAPDAAPHNPVMPPVDDAAIAPLDNSPLLGPVDRQIILNTGFTTINGIHRAQINNITYLEPKVPTLYTALSMSNRKAQDMSVYGKDVNPIPIKSGEIVEVVINNNDNAGHPWHMHGRTFQVVARSGGGVLPAGAYNPDNLQLPATPMRRDTVGVRPGGWVVLRFKGTHILHCHIEWHVAGGLTATLIESPELLDEKIPLGHKLACIKQNMPYFGNAAGRIFMVENTDGANDGVQQENWGALYSNKDRRRAADMLAAGNTAKRDVFGKRAPQLDLLGLPGGAADEPSSSPAPPEGKKPSIVFDGSKGGGWGGPLGR
ncbi:multicopper oxidase [Aulographum hederae CBS 113979]|uniref:Multicopper oxidase n=1 Tax=Aulographum hederae CBS 113979 TaxID=1176131 RepID=A0A6G1HD40_9PEZI|nr:multicopper oxidase [Aulographum hederae CBS 113979]